MYIYVTESEHSGTEREEVTAKLDGTEDTDPEDLTVGISTKPPEFFYLFV